MPWAIERVNQWLRYKNKNVNDSLDQRVTIEATKCGCTSDSLKHNDTDR